MTIKEMHYDFKKKLNKIDSQQNKNLLVPEIDWTLREAEDIFIKIVAEPRLRNHLGFEVNQRSIDDIRGIVLTTTINVVDGVAAIPGNYKYYIKAEATISKGNCKGKKARVHIRQHDDMFEESPFHKSSFEWGVVNGVFNQDGLKVFTDGSFTIEKVDLTYIRNPKIMHNAEDFRAGQYTLPSGVLLTGFENCELPSHTHREIVDIAVVLASSEINTSDLQVKLNKLSMNQLI